MPFGYSKDKVLQTGRFSHDAVQIPSPTAYSPTNAVTGWLQKTQGGSQDFVIPRRDEKKAEIPPKIEQIEVVEDYLDRSLDEVLSPYLPELGRRKKEEEIEKIEIKKPTSNGRPKLKIPEGYDEIPEVAEFMNPHLQKWTEKHELEMEHEDEVKGYLADCKLLMENEDLTEDEDRFEASEFVEYRSHEWCIAVPIERTRTADRNVYEHLVFSHQRGIDRILLTTEQRAILNNTLLIKYRKLEDGSIEAIPIYSALPSNQLLTLKCKNNKGIELRLYGLINFVDFDKDRNSDNHRTVIWTDAIGPVYLTSVDRSNLRRKFYIENLGKAFGPLRMCQITVKGEFDFSVPNGSIPKWNITSFVTVPEEGPKEPSVGRNCWPARALRFDDLVVTQTTSAGTWLESYKEPKLVKVLAGPNLTGIINNAGPEYAASGVMTGVVVPSFMKNEFSHFEALIVGPLKVVELITEGRLFNYCPKTWPPSVEKMRQEYREETERVHNLRRKGSLLDPLARPYFEPLKSLGNHSEFHFDFEDPI